MALYYRSSWYVSEEILKNIPEGRMKDVIYFNPADLESL